MEFTQQIPATLPEEHAVVQTQEMWELPVASFVPQPLGLIYQGSKPKHSRNKISNPGWAGIMPFWKKPLSSLDPELCHSGHSTSPWSSVWSSDRMQANNMRTHTLYIYIHTRIQLHITLYHIIWHEHVRCFPRNDDWQDSWMAESTLGMPHRARNIAKQVSPSAPHLSCLHGLVENITEWLTWHGNHRMVIWHMDRGKDKLLYFYLGSN